MNDDENTVENNDEASAEAIVYELGYHILSTVEEEKVAEEVANIKDLINKNGGTFIAEELPSMLRLAYTIIRRVGGKREKYDMAYFGWIKFELGAAAITNIKEELDKNSNILRFLIMKTVREDTRAPKRPVVQRSEEAPVRGTTPAAGVTEKKATAPATSEEELDRTIDELVVE